MWKQAADLYKKSVPSADDDWELGHTVIHTPIILARVQVA